MLPPVSLVFNFFQPKIFLTIFKSRKIQQVTIMGKLKNKLGAADMLGRVSSDMVSIDTIGKIRLYK